MNNQPKQFELDKDSGSVDITMLQYMHPAVVVMIAWTNLWCKSNGIRAKWTSWMRTEEQNRALGATDVHLSRAADLSVKGWRPGKLTLFKKEFTAVFKSTGAFGRDGRRRPIVIHDSGHGMHAHLQVDHYANVDQLIENPQAHYTVKRARA